MMQAQQPAPEIATLFDAIRRGDSVAVRALLAANPRLADARNPQGTTTVLWSVYTRHPELAPVLLGVRQPDLFESCALGDQARALALLAAIPIILNAHAPDGFTPLGLAVYFGHAGLARQLVAAGADVNLPSSNDFRVFPLHSAVANGNLELVELLLASGAKPDPPEFLGATPLHSAAALGSKRIVTRLLAAGADRTLHTKEGKTAATLARENNHPEVAEILEAF